LLFDRPPFDPYNISSLPDSHFVSIYPGASLPSVSETTPLMQVHMAPPYTFFTPPHLVYAQSHPSSSASSLTATPFGFRVGDAPSYFTPFHGGYIPTGFADYRSAYESYQGDNESEEEDDSEPTAKVRPDAATAVKPIVVERDGRTPIAATISQDSVDFHVCTTPDGALIICHQDGSRTLINSDSTDVAALFCDGRIKVRSLLTSGGGTEVTKILNNPGLENVAVSEHRKYARWTEEEDDTLREAIDKYGPPPYDWNRISRRYFKGLRSSLQCKNRWKKVRVDDYVLAYT
jgi:Myb-like DNA-binding domain